MGWPWPGLATRVRSTQMGQFQISIPYVLISFEAHIYAVGSRCVNISKECDKHCQGLKTRRIVNEKMEEITSSCTLMLRG